MPRMGTDSISEGIFEVSSEPRPKREDSFEPGTEVPPPHPDRRTEEPRAPERVRPRLRIAVWPEPGYFCTCGNRTNTP